MLLLPAKLKGSCSNLGRAILVRARWGVKYLIFSTMSMLCGSLYMSCVHRQRMYSPHLICRASKSSALTVTADNSILKDSPNPPYLQALR